MKRSEMVKIIANNLLNNVMSRDDYSLSIVLATRLLNLIEQNGMLPPERITYSDNGINVLCPSDCSWEPENEKE